MGAKVYVGSEVETFIDEAIENYLCVAVTLPKKRMRVHFLQIFPQCAIFVTNNT